MFDPAPDRDPASRGERWASGIFLVVLLGLFLAEILTDYSPVKLSALFVVLAWIPLLALHEAGHALAARLLGWHVGQIVIGFGATWKSFRLGSARVDLRLLPVEGFVKCVPSNLRQPRLKNAIIYFAGPGMDLLAAALVLAFLGADRLFSASNHYGIIACQSFALAGLTQAILNLIPLSTLKGGQEIANDGLGILRSFTLPDRHFAQQIEAFRELGPAYFEDRPPEPPPEPPPEEWWNRDRRL